MPRTTTSRLNDLRPLGLSRGHLGIQLSWLEHLLCKQRVAGSNPAISTEYRGVEQLVARQVHILEVVGSNPTTATMKQEEILLQEELLDVISERPYPFTVGKKHFYLYPVTLGKTFLLKRQIENLQINQENIQKNVNLEILRVVKEKRNVCCTILAYHTCKTKEELFSTKIIAERRNLTLKIQWCILSAFFF